MIKTDCIPSLIKPKKLIADTQHNFNFGENVDVNMDHNFQSQ